jgi:uncharacterized protein YndB with AHSA1/START domain
MADDTLAATKLIDASAEDVFAVLADPSKHAAIDGTGWVCEAVDREPLTQNGQIFRMGMYHPNHPDKNYEMANQIVAFDRPRTIAWKPGYRTDDGGLGFGGWIWRYDLTPSGAATTVTLTYDWSEVSESVREHIGFPPFAADHLDNSLAHLAELVRS